MKNVDIHGHKFKTHTSSYQCVSVNCPAVSVSGGNNQNRIHKHRSTTLHNTILQLHYPEWSSDVFAWKNFYCYRKCPRRWVHILNSANRSCLAVGLPLRPVEAAALKLQPWQTELLNDSLGADPITRHHRGHRLQIGRPGKTNILSGKRNVLVFSRDSVHVVRCGKLFRETFNTVVFGDRHTDLIPIVGQSVSVERRRLVSEQNYQLKHIRY